MNISSSCNDEAAESKNVVLDETLVVWCTEFGRMPTFQKGASGRDHNPDGFTAWLAGAGVKSGYSYGATDRFGWKAEQNISRAQTWERGPPLV